MRTSILGGEILDQLLILSVPCTVEDLDQLFGRQSLGVNAFFWKSEQPPGMNRLGFSHVFGAADDIPQMVTEHESAPRPPAGGSKPYALPGGGKALLCLWKDTFFLFNSQIRYHSWRNSVKKRLRRLTSRTNPYIKSFCLVRVFHRQGAF